MYKVGTTGSGVEGKTYLFSEGYQFNRYLSKGNIVEIPHNHCPECWGEWDFKTKGSSCPECGATFGEEVKFLIDSDECPRCHDGHVSQTNPHCDKCDFVAEDDMVIWG